MVIVLAMMIIEGADVVNKISVTFVGHVRGLASIVFILLFIGFIRL